MKVLGMEHVLDRGYVSIPEDGVLGTDRTVVNAARVSFDKAVSEMGPSDVRLLDFLARNGHTSPFRHVALQFEVHAPLMVARQWWKYVVGSNHQDNFLGWNEGSRRYIDDTPQFYIPNSDAWRSAPDNRKQGSGEPVDMYVGANLSSNLMKYIDQGEQLYQQAIADGVATEQARLFLPAYGMYVRWYWTISLQGLSHFLKQRLKNDAQVEIQEYAKAVEKLARPHFPLSLEALMKYE